MLLTLHTRTEPPGLHICSPLSSRASALEPVLDYLFEEENWLQELWICATRDKWIITPSLAPRMVMELTHTGCQSCIVLVRFARRSNLRLITFSSK